MLQQKPDLLLCGYEQMTSTLVSFGGLVDTDVPAAASSKQTFALLVRGLFLII